MEEVNTIDVNKISILEHGVEEFYSKPVKCNNLILMLCKNGEIDVEINYVNYTLKKDGFLSIAPYDIVAFKESKGDFKSQTLVLPFSMFTPVIAELRMKQYDYVKKNPLIYFNEDYLKMIETTFEFINRASNLLDEERFEQVVIKQVSSLYYVQQQFYTNCDESETLLHECVSRKKELFRLFIKSLVESHSVSREVLFYANELGVSSGYLNEICNDISHHTAKEIIDSAVSARLKYELSYTSKSIQELADEYNFPSQSYFSRYYKRMTGMTPSEFRKRG
ncbi:MAG: AraC family transcriptional regulator [Bacteroidaceae bacterium]|nr:AraC family transcriptional regulator [Bacteroidaceae bacterium]